MEKAQFWDIIARARARAASDGDCETVCESIKRMLTPLTTEEIVGFDKCVTEYRFLAYRADLWGAAVILKGGCSNDAFEYFRCWLIAQGESIYRNALEDPESLAEFEPWEIAVEADDFECEDFMHISDQAYEEKTGQEIPETMMYSGKYPKLVGELLSEDGYYEMYPKLAARFEG